MNPKKDPEKRKKNAGLSLSPEIIALLEKHRGKKSKSLYAEEIIVRHFRAHATKLSPDEKSSLGRESI